MKHFIAGFLVVAVSGITSILIGYGLGKLVAEQHSTGIQQIGKDFNCAK